MATAQQKWQVWDEARSYGETLFRRASGELPEMESSKKMAREVRAHFSPGDSVLDVGCGAGHYYRSLRRELSGRFHYTGVDATSYYIELAQQAHADQRDCEFHVGNVFQLDLPDSSFEIVMCNNLLLHLPSIAKPLAELVRVTRRVTLVRFLCGQRSFAIKDVHPQADGSEFGEDHEPTAFHYYNIYSESYVRHVLSTIPGIASFRFTPDVDFDQQKILASASDHQGAHDATLMLGGFQVNGYVLQPWCILEIARDAA